MKLHKSLSLITAVAAATFAGHALAAPIIVDISSTNSAGTRAAVATADGSKNVAWNEVAGSGSIASLVDTAGSATGISFAFSSTGTFSGNGASRTNNETDFTATTPASMFSIGMIRSSLGKTSSNTATTYLLSNLDPAKEYDFDFLCSLPLANGGTSRFTLVGDASVTDTIASAGNTSLLSFDGVKPNTSGQISITWAYVSGTHAPLNVFQFEQAIPEPASLALIAVGGLMLIRRRKA